MRIIGDCHGNYEKYMEIANGSDYSIQLGDLGFSYCYHKIMETESFDVSRHKFFRGNHDDFLYQPVILGEDGIGYKNYEERFNEFNLGEYGMRELDHFKFWFTRGAFSIDYKYRKQWLDWFPNEEIEYALHDKIVEEYEAAKPDVVITHDCPQNIGHDGLKGVGILKSFGFNPETFNTKTGILLQRMFDAHQPKLWFFGHYHREWVNHVNGTAFVCIPEFGCIDLKLKE